MTYYTLTLHLYSHYAFLLPHYLFIWALQHLQSPTSQTVQNTLEIPIIFLFIFLYNHIYSCTLHTSIAHFSTSCGFLRIDKQIYLFYIPHFHRLFAFFQVSLCYQTRSDTRSHIFICSCQLYSSYRCISKFSLIHFQAAVGISRAHQPLWMRFWVVIKSTF